MEWSVNRPRFLHRNLNALLRGIHGVSLVRRGIVACADAVNSGAITAIAIGQKPGNASDGGDADASQVLNLAVGEALLEQFDHLPAGQRMPEVRPEYTGPEENYGIRRHL